MQADTWGEFPNLGIDNILSKYATSDLRNQNIQQDVSDRSLQEAQIIAEEKF
jgi:hypothetical protein